jgi:sugar lactone lactonase YvrE
VAVRVHQVDPTGANLGRTGWNDIVVDGRGNAYVNRVGFDLMAGEGFKPGFVALVTPDGSVREVADAIALPNGMAVTPDDSTLIVADSHRHNLVALPAPSAARREDSVHRGEWRGMSEMVASYGHAARHPGRP